MFSQLNKSETENRAAVLAITDQNTKFQLEFSRSCPTRAEMNENLDRVTDAVRDMMMPLRDDLRTIKEALLKGKSGGN